MRRGESLSEGTRPREDTDLGRHVWSADGVLSLSCVEGGDGGVDVQASQGCAVEVMAVLEVVCRHSRLEKAAAQ